LHLTRTYVATWSPEKLEGLPPFCRPVAILSGDDIASYGLALARGRLAALPGQEREWVEEMANFFSAAALRLAEILAAQRGVQTSHAFLRSLEEMDKDS